MGFDTPTTGGGGGTTFNGVSSISPGFGNWTVPNSNSPTLVTVRGSTETDGSTAGVIQYQVDESGGTTPDYTGILALAGEEAGSGFSSPGDVTLPIPAGGAFRVVNAQDPNAGNVVFDVFVQEVG